MTTSPLAFTQIPTFPDYEIAPNGCVRRIRDARVGAQWVSDKNDKTMTNVALGKTQRSLSVAYLLACTFIPIEPPLTVATARVFHKDANPANHTLSNLEWRGRQYAKTLKTLQALTENKVKFSTPDFSQVFDGYYPHAVECAAKPGYFFMPESDLPVVVNRDGVFFNLAADKEVPVFKTDTYTLVAIRIGGKYVSNYVHRLLAKIFVAKPTRHADVPLHELVVNHIDGVKHHNWLGNLEWVSTKENNVHAIQTGLTSHQAVLTRDVRTGAVAKYSTAKELALTLKISEKRLNKHLNSPRVGRVTKDWQVFKYDNPVPWPTLEREEDSESSWDSTFGIWLAMSESTSIMITANTLDQMADALKLSYTGLQHHVVHHKAKPYAGWIFVYDDAPTADRVANLPERYKPKWIGSLPVEVTNRETGEVTVYPSRAIAGKRLCITDAKIRYAMGFLDGVCGSYVFKDVQPTPPV
jgi:hypothetical protein